MQPIEHGKVPKFSVIVPAYNAAATLPSCLEALSSQTVLQEFYEVIVVDDGSVDGTCQMAEKADVRCLCQTKQGPAAARNRGAAAAKGKILLFTDADCVPADNWIEEMVKPFEDPRVQAVKGAYRTRQRELIARFAQTEFNDRYDLLAKSSFIDMIDTHSAALRKEIFMKMGGFDRSFPTANNEDTDLSYRMAATGCRMVFNPNAFVFHTHPPRLGTYLRIKFWRGYWRMVVYRRYPRKALKDSYTPLILKAQTALMAVSIPLSVFSIAAPACVIPMLLIWGAVMVSALPFAAKAFKNDKIVGLISPVVILLRSAVFAAGSLLGIVRSFSFPSSARSAD